MLFKGEGDGFQGRNRSCSWSHIGHITLVPPRRVNCLGVQSLCALLKLVLAAARISYELSPLLSLPYSSSSMALPNLSIPSISISLADDPPVHLHSPLDAQPPFLPTQEDEYRSSFLSPPPVFSPRFHRQPSPLRPTETPSAGKGLDQACFEALLASTREKNVATKKGPNMRKELAMKAHKSKQSELLSLYFLSCANPLLVERRALFLSKVNAPPSPTATALPKTPPESPAILHYTLPSPGLNSPLALFESLPVQPSSVKPWVEQVQYRQLKSASVRPPSLEQITAHLSSHGHPATATTAKDEYHRPPIPLPTFLRFPPRMKAARGVLQHYVGSGEETDGEPELEAEITPPIPRSRELFEPLPKTHAVPSLSGPGLLVTTTMIPGTSNSSSGTLTAVNLSALNSRALTGRDMMSKLKRRVSGFPSADGVGGYGVDDDERRARRVSAPAELPKRERDGFAHLVLALPGAF